MKKSAALVAVPVGVRTVIGPDVVADDGTAVEMLAVVALVTSADVMLNFVKSFAGAVSKFVPVMVTDVPGVPIVGVNPVIVGAPTPTVNDCWLVADPLGVVTLSGPVVAPSGTIAVNSVA